MYCLNCGFEIMEGSKFCSECGTRVPQKEPIVLTNHKEEMEKVIRELKKKVWYYFVDLKPEGPFTDEELTRLFEEGTIKTSTEIWHIESDEAIPYVQKDSFVFEKAEPQKTELDQVDDTEEIPAEEIEQTVEAAAEKTISEKTEVDSIQPYEDSDDTVSAETEISQMQEEEIVSEEPADVEQIVQTYVDEEPESEIISEQSDQISVQSGEDENAADEDTAIVWAETITQSEEVVSDETDWAVEEEYVEEHPENQTDVYSEDQQALIEDVESQEDQTTQEEAKWYYVDGANNRQGPVTDTVFHALIDEGIIHEMTYIWTSGMNTWLFLKDWDQYSSTDDTRESQPEEEAEVFGVDQYWEEEPDSEDQYKSEAEPENKPIEENWYYVDRSNMRQGPLSSERIRSLIQEGVIHERTYLWTSGMAGWELMKNTDFYNAEPEQSKDWYYIDSARVRQGKFSDAEMDQFLSQGVITDKTYVWKAGMPQWALLKDTALFKGEKVSISQDDDELWFYRGRDNSRVGPFTAEEMEELLSRGTINYQTDVWKRGMSNWKPLSSALHVGKPQRRETEWYVQLHGQTMGPYPESTVIQMLQNNEINGRTYVWSAGMQDWEQLKNTSIPKVK